MRAEVMTGGASVTGRTLHASTRPRLANPAAAQQFCRAAPSPRGHSPSESPRGARGWRGGAGRPPPAPHGRRESWSAHGSHSSEEASTASG